MATEKAKTEIWGAQTIRKRGQRLLRFYHIPPGDCIAVFDVELSAEESAQLISTAMQDMAPLREVYLAAKALCAFHDDPLSQDIPTLLTRLKAALAQAEAHEP